MRTALISLLLLVGLAGCSGEADPYEVRDELDSLRAEIRRIDFLSREIEALRSDLAEMKRSGDGMSESDKRARLSAPSSEAVFPATFNPSNRHRDDPFLGTKDGEILVMLFIDYECKPCRQLHRDAFPRLERLVEENPRLQLIVRDFPLQTHSNAVAAAFFAHCAGEQGKYWQAFDLLFSRPEIVKNGEWDTAAEYLSDIDDASLISCIQSSRYQSEILGDIEDGTALGAQGVPSLFVGRRGVGRSYDGVFIRGAQPFALIEHHIKKALGPNPKAR